MATTRQDPHDRDVLIRVFEPGVDPRSAALGDLPDLVSVDDNVVWVDLPSSAHASLRAVSELLDLHGQAVRAALAPGTRPGLDLYDRHLFFSATVPRPGVRAVDARAQRVDLFVGRNFVVSAHTQPLPFADRVQARARQDAALLRRDAAYLLYIVLDELLAYHAGFAGDACGASVAVQERALRDTRDPFLTDLLHARREIALLAEAASEYRTVVAAVAQPDCPWTAGVEVSMGLADVTARLATLCDALDAAREATDGAFDLYLARGVRDRRQAITTYAAVGALLTPFAVVVVLTLIIGVVDGTVHRAALGVWASLLVRIFVRVLAVGALVLVIMYRYGQQRAACRARIRDGRKREVP